MSHGGKKKHDEEEHENHERWLVSYADFITLLFAFFVVMYSVSRVETKRLVQAAQSIQWALHYGGSGGVGQMPIFDMPAAERGSLAEAGGGTSETQEQSKRLRRAIEVRIRPFIIQREGPAVVTVVVDGRRVTLRLAAAEFFDPGQSALRPQVVPILDAIAAEVVPLARPLHIEGHTDDTAVSGARFRDNWELSAARAATVASYLERAHGARPALLSATGFAATRPLARGDTAAARELNRRVEMVIDFEVKDEGTHHHDAPAIDPTLQ